MDMGIVVFSNTGGGRGWTPVAVAEAAPPAFKIVVSLNISSLSYLANCARV